MVGLTHPDILRYERFGVPECEKIVCTCSNCGYEIGEDSCDEYYDFGSLKLCGDCVLEYRHFG